MLKDKIDGLLDRVQKPARYVGGEYNEVRKDKSSVELRVAFCFPDTYEIGMSNLGFRILDHTVHFPAHIAGRLLHTVKQAIDLIFQQGPSSL